jgi:hypothetical protein
MDLLEPVQEQYRSFMPFAAGYSPCFAEWAAGVADDPPVMAWIARLPQIKQQPNLVFAAARWHGVPAPGPYDGLRDALLSDDGTIRATILARATQTNEAGRLATLTPAFAALAQGEPLALVEAGASAGLCLYPDRWGYEWTTGSGVVTVGPADRRLTCTVDGAAPFPDRVPEVAWRRGIDLNPLDVTDVDHMAWLTNLVWPEHDARRALLRQAIEIATDDPPTIVSGDLLTMIPEQVALAAEHGRVVVFHSAVIAYLGKDQRARFTELMTDLVGDGACHWVSNEGPKILPDVYRTGPVMPDEVARLVLGVDGRAVAWTDGHGRAMTWLSVPS